MEDTKYKTIYIISIFFALLIRSMLAYYIPITGDEAYFIEWGRHPALGYYDHTPLLGWILYCLLCMSDSVFWMRLPAILLPVPMTLAMVGILKRYHPSKAYLTGILFSLSPAALFLVFITTDIPLIFFSFFSGIFLFLAIKNDKLYYYLLCGLCLGLAFFSKYLAVLLALSYVVYFLFSQKSKRKTVGFLIVFLCVLPFGIINIYWNYTHNWANIIFNVYSRNRFLGFKWENPIVCCLSLMYLLSPIVGYYFIKYYKKLSINSKTNTSEQDLLQLNTLLFLTPFCFFLILTVKKSVGLHWLFSFTPFAYFCLWWIIDENQFIRSIKFSTALMIPQLMIAFGILFIPIQAWQSLHLKETTYASLVSDLKHREIARFLMHYCPNFTLASHSFSDVYTLMYDSKLPVYLFGYGSEHGRQNDFQEDFKLLNHRNILIFSDDILNVEDYQPYFERVELKCFHLHAAKFYYVLGYNFKYAIYREVVLREIKNYFWTIPHFLPHAANFYCLKYFSEEGCAL